MCVSGLSNRYIRLYHCCYWSIQESRIYSFRSSYVRENSETKRNNTVKNSMLNRECIQLDICSMLAYDFPLLLAYAPVISPLSMTINSSLAALTERSSPGKIDTPNPAGTVVVRGVKSTDGIDGVIVMPWLGSIKDEES